MTGTLDQVFTPEHKKESLRYLRNHQNKDGGFGLHIEGGSTMFGTSMSYVTARLLGVGPDDEMMVQARAWVSPSGLLALTLPPLMQEQERGTREREGFTAFV